MRAKKKRVVVSYTLFLKSMVDDALLLELRDQLRHHIKKVCNQTVVSNLEDRCLRVLVDCNDGLGPFHTGEVLDGAADADREVEVGSNDFASLADLEVVRNPTSVADGTTRADTTV